VTTGITIPMLFKKFDTDGDGQIDSSWSRRDPKLSKVQKI